MAQNETTISELDPITVPSDDDNLMIESDDLADTKRITFGSLVSAIIAKFIPLSIERGGTGANTVAGARNALGLGNTDGALPVACGGTGNISVDTTPTSNSTKMVTSGGVKAAIESLQSTFQAGVNAIYNAIVAQGVTPSASTPTACATAIGTVATNKYNAGKTAAEAVTWTETIDVYLMPTTSTVTMNIDMSSVKEITITNKNNGSWDYAAANYSDAGRAQTSSGTNGGWSGTGGTAGTTMSSANLMSKINSTYKYLVIANQSSSYKGLTITIIRQAKKLR